MIDWIFILFLLHLDHHPNHVDTCEDENPNYIKEVPVQADDEYFSGCHCSQPMLFQLDKDCYHPADTQGNVDTVRTRQCKETCPESTGTDCCYLMCLKAEFVYFESKAAEAEQQCDDEPHHETFKRPFPHVMNG